MDQFGRGADDTRLCERNWHTVGWRFRRFRLLFLCIFLLLSFSIVPPLSSKDRSSADSQFSSALWIAQKKKLSKHLTDATAKALDIARTYDALSIDSTHHVVWAAYKEGIDVWAFDGSIISEIPLRLRKQHSVLSINDESGDIWLGAGKYIAHFSKDAVLLGQTQVEDDILAIDADAPHERMWVATHKHIDAFDSSGRHPVNITPGDVSDIKAFEYDPSVNGLWVSANTHGDGFDKKKWSRGSNNDKHHHKSSDYNDSGSKRGHVRNEPGRVDGQSETGDENRSSGRESGDSHARKRHGADSSDVASSELYRVSEFGRILYSVPVHDIRFLQSTPDGYLWAASNKKLFRIYSETGQILFSIYPFEGHGDIQALSLSPGNDGVWIARNREVKKISNEALVLQRISTARKINDIAAYQDLIPPQISIPAPKAGSVLQSAKPTIHVEYSDDASGVDSESLSLSFDDNPLQCSCESEVDGADCLPLVALPDGELALSAKVKDFAGNVSPTALTTITVDTLPPEILVESPADGEVTEDEVTNIKGRVSEDADVTVNGHPVDLVGFDFSRMLSLEEGENTIRIGATDQAGNTSTVAIHVTREVGDATPPEIQVPPNRVVEATDEFTPVALGRAAASDEKDGTVLAFPSVLGPFPVGTSEIVWTATDTSGNSRQATQLVTVRDTTPPVLFPPPHISTESLGPVSLDIGKANATDIFGPVIITNDAPAEFPIGSTVVTWKARDRNGNTVTETQTITILSGKDQTRENGWQEAELLEFDDTGDALDPVVVKNEEGEAIAVWAQEDEQGVFNLMARYFSPKSNWNDPQLVEHVTDNILFTTTGVVGLNDDMNTAGEGIVLWSFEHEGYFYNTFNSDTGWGAARHLSIADAGSGAYLEDIQHTSDGSFITIWRVYENDGSANLVARRYSTESGWGSAETLETNAPDVYSVLARIATNADGGAMIVWERREPRFPDFPAYGSISRGTWSSSSNPNGEWSDPASMNIFTPDSDIVDNGPHFLDVVLTDSGSAAATWLEPGIGINEPVRILSKTYSPVTGWTTSTEIQRQTPEATVPQLVRGAGDNLYVVWLATDARVESFQYNYELRYSRSADGGLTWTKPRVAFAQKDIDSVVGENNHVSHSRFLDVEGDDSGFIHAMFSVTIQKLNERPRKPLLLVVTYYPGIGWGAPEIISRQLPDTFMSKAVMRSDRQGNALAVWEQRESKNNRTDIWTSRLILPLSENVTPVADAGVDITVPENGALTLDATKSMDPDGSVYRYKWIQLEGPPVVIDDPASPLVHIDAAPVVDSDATLQFELEVTDNRNRRNSDVVTVRVRNLSVDEDKSAPVVHAPHDVSVSAIAVLTPVDLEYGNHAAAFDNADGELVPVPDPPGPFPLGDTVVTWSAADAAGNVGHATQKVTVYDSQVPTLTIPDDVSVESSVPVAVDIGVATAEDIFGPVSVTNDAPAVFPLGRTEVLWSATDQNGNTRTAVQNVSVAPSIWGEPVLLEFDTAPARVPSLDMDRAGNAVAVWLEDDGTRYAVMSNHYSPNSGWNGTETIASVPEGGITSVSDPQVANYGQGAAIAVWYQVNSSDRRVMFSRLDPDTGWSEPTKAFEGTYADLTISGGSGSVAMAAVQYPGRNLITSRFTNAEGWSAWFVVDSDVLVRGFDIDVSDTGRAAIVWSESNDVKLRYLEPSTGWSAIVRPIGGFGEYPKTAINSEGAVFLAWNHRVSSYSYEPYATVFRPGGGFEAVTPLDSRSYEIGDIAAGNNGGAIVSWTYRSLYSSLYTLEAGWSHRERYDFFPVGGDTYVNLGVDDSGNVLALWRHNTGGAIFANRLAPGVGWGYPEGLAMDTGSFGNKPVLAVPPDGHAIAVWQQEDLDGIKSIWANRLLDTSVPNQPPVANASEDRNIFSGVDTTLDGSGSSDPEGSLMNVEWKQVAGPLVNISNSTTLLAMFTTPDAQPGTQLVFQLSVTDARGATDTDSVILTVAKPDLVPPDVTPPPDRIVEASGSLTPVELGNATAVDGVDGKVPAAPSEAGPFSLGEHKITWSATDSSGNTGTAQQLVVVVDTTPPIVTAPVDVAVVAAYAADLDIGSASASDVLGPVAIQNDAPGEFPVGETLVTWTATDANGNTATAVQSVRVEAEITISITTPVGGLETAAGSVLVSGIVIAPQNTGVVVNGRIAYVDRSSAPARFHAVVPLSLGENVITVVATHLRGESVARTVNVLRTEVSRPSFIVSATPKSGMAPLDVTFAPQWATKADSSISDKTIYVVDYDFDGDGTIDVSRSSFTVGNESIAFEPIELTEPVTYSYDTPGTYLARVTINDLHNVDPRLDAIGETFTIPIEVSSRQRKDQMFHEIWNDLLESLAERDIESALEHFSPSARPKYEEAFSTLMPNIDKVIPNLGELVHGELIGDELAIYVIRRGDRGFPIQFVRGADGIWRISEM